MNDSIRESFSYFSLYRKMLQVQKRIVPESVSFGTDKNQYFLYYEPACIISDKIIFWVHGGGWNAGTPNYFDFVGQCVANAGYKASMQYLDSKKINTSKVIVSGSSAGAHLSSILCYSKSVQDQYDVNVSNVIGFGEPCSLMDEGSIPMLLIQSRHDGLIDFSCAERFYEKAAGLGTVCELYEVVDKKNTHSWYTAGMFLETRNENKGLDHFFSWIEKVR